MSTRSVKKHNSAKRRRPVKSVKSVKSQKHPFLFHTTLSYDELNKMHKLQHDLKQLFYSHDIRSMEEINQPVLKQQLQHLIDSNGGYEKVMKQLSTITHHANKKYHGTRYLLDGSKWLLNSSITIAKGSFFLGSIFADTSSATSIGKNLLIRLSSGIVVGGMIGLPLIAMSSVLVALSWLATGWYGEQ